MEAIEFKEWRRRLGLTQEKAAELIGTSRVTIGNWESGNTPIWVSIERVCRDVELTWKQEQASFGPVILYWHIGQLSGAMINSSSPPPERFDTNDAAVGRACELRRKYTMQEMRLIAITDLDGNDLWSAGQLEREVTRRLANEQRVTSENKVVGTGKRTPEEAAAMRRDMDEFVRRFREEHAGETFLTDDEMYDEYGLPK
jgi:DNA-binding XRE family transcriptional regulator